MREHLFRGFYECKDGETVITVCGNQKRGKWVEGDLSHNKRGQSFILENLLDTGYAVIPETVSEYTGFNNGEKFFEGDIFKDGQDNIYAIRFVDYRFVAIDGTCECSIDDILDNYCSVIGNIFDNPELLEV